MTRTIYDTILEGVTEQEAIEWAQGFDFSECESHDYEMPTYRRFILLVNGVNMWYDFGADYYFFTEQ